MRGYRELRESAAWLDLAGRGKIRMTGEDRARLLHAMTTNHVQQLQPWQGCYAFFLTAQGRILGDVNILCREDDLLLDTEPETATKLYAHLDKFIIVDDVTLEDLTGAMATIAVEGPAAEDALRKAGAPVPSCAYSGAAWGSAVVVRVSYTGGPGWFVFSPAAERNSLIAAIEQAGAAAADLEAADVVRLEHGKPRFGDDLSERYLAQETNQIHALHFNKGCYLGQEIVERVRSRAQIHRRLLPLHLDTDTPPARGAKLQAAGKDAAEITSAAFSPALGKTVALAYVRIDSKPGDVLSLGDISATVLAAPAPPTPEPADCR
jgi:folate-binding protein YgfZ